ncbi:LytTR family transcriptional regulator [Fibrisoma montanum]|uniref:LytTR family transcriptional regulator n=1 Tax=Fibrisoma montanum TaxID=2305895 RepID=A0A418MB75_9BACT|nr:LytTR family DNA-binding domain-containing protein [Fibrisoma montanum]RIV23625.1 LytTR family transcriptional regulator [Fibrisoma montanum]
MQPILSRLEADQIQYVKGSGPYAEIHYADPSRPLSKRMLVVSHPVKAVAMHLPGFVRIHKSFLVNPAFVEKSSAFDPKVGGTVTLQSGHQLPISRRVYFEVIKLLPVLILLLLSSCTSFEKAFRKYGRTVNDTTYTTVQLTVPKDSSILVVKTDTTRIVERVRQGRATVTIIREPTNTTVLAECDTVVVEKRVPGVIRTQLWGVDPKFEKQAKRWRTAFLILAGLVIAVLAAVWFLKRFTVGVQVQRRNPPTRLENNHPW